MKDNTNVKTVQTQVSEWLKKIDSSGLPGKFKAWIYQHGLLPRLTWLLMIYEMTTTTVETIARKINSHLRRWLGVPPSFTAIELYSRSAQLQLPLSSAVEEYKVAKSRLVMTRRDSKDNKISNVGIQTRTGRKWSARTAVDQAESTLHHKDIVGNTCVGRQGLGMTHFQQWSKATTKEKSSMVQTEIRQVEEDQRRAKAVELSSQGAWMKWNLPEKKITWAELWRMEPFRISFMLRSVYDTQTALTQGRYRWRHDKVLQVLAEILEVERRKKRPKTTAGKQINFIREGETGQTTKSQQHFILDKGSEWEMRADLNKKLVFPDCVQTTLRPDIVVRSEISKMIVVVELTVPWEERCEEAYHRKKEKYTELMTTCRERGWKTWLFPVEVGCRGFPAQSVWRMLQAMGIVGRTRNTAVRQLGEAAERSSCWLWHRRDDLSWKPSADQ